MARVLKPNFSPIVNPGRGDYVRDFEPRLAHLEASLGAIAGQVVSLEKGIHAQGQKLDDLIRVLGERDARRPAPWDQVIRTVKDAGVLMAMCAAAIVYVAANHSAPDMAVMKYKLDQVQTRIERMAAPPVPLAMHRDRSNG